MRIFNYRAPLPLPPFACWLCGECPFRIYLFSVQFLDMNGRTLFRPYRRQIQRLDEMERILRFLELEISKLPRATIVRGPQSAVVFIDGRRGSSSGGVAATSPASYTLDAVEVQLRRLYDQFVQFKTNNAELVEQRNKAIEMKHVALAAAAAAAGRPDAAGLLPQQQQQQQGRSTVRARKTAAEKDAAGNLIKPEPTLLGKPRAQDDDYTGTSHDEAYSLEHQTLLTNAPRDGEGERSIYFTNVAGLIPSCETGRFSRSLFRMSRGNALVCFHAISAAQGASGEESSDRLIDPQTGSEATDSRSVFVIYFQAAAGPGNASVMQEKVGKICDAFGAHIYPWPADAEDALTITAGLDATISDKAKALTAYERYFTEEIDALLVVTPASGGLTSQIEEWRLFCRKERAIYEILNRFEGTDLTMRCDCWYPKAKADTIRRCLRAADASEYAATPDRSFDAGKRDTPEGPQPRQLDGVAYHQLEQEQKSHDLETQAQFSALLLVDKDQSHKHVKAPTYIPTNELSGPFQALVDTYGVPRYQEANPAIFAVPFFPFLFGIMYGDIGHGMAILIFGVVLCCLSSKLKKSKWVEGEMTGMIVQGRYMFVLMGLAATFAGFLYNDFFSIGCDIFGKRWTVDEFIDNNTQTTWKQSVGTPFPYPFGVDPVWKGARNELQVLNSFKMKFSVIVGFFHMAIGVLLKASNAIYFKQPLDFFFEFIPQLVFLCCFVGYMNFLIVFCWVTNWASPSDKPSIINVIIDMCMLSPVEKQIYPGQDTVQKALVVLMLLSVPTMLIVKPVAVWWMHRRQLQRSRPSHTGPPRWAAGRNSTGRPKDHLEVQQRLNDPTCQTPDSPLEFVGGELDSSSATSAPASEATKSRASYLPARSMEIDERAHVASFSSGSAPEHFEEADGEEDEDFGLGEVLIHQVIETIEFVLGTISNTASYLRLWALSLAHNQLSLIFFQRTVMIALGIESLAVKCVSLPIAMILFYYITLGVMLGMDALECFLHALRLQWVEFQNKFYKADGVKFHPFNLRTILQGTDEEE
eukprot:GHVT01075557.1.p1 GENE.GHVT01075557.1~~GHVT01075557.1.p1  ORF type:complete len:1038 (-),score=213.86 GHVT01075557.1:937-4050(-)